MIIEGPVFCLEEFRSLSDVHSAFKKMASMVKVEINNRCPDSFVVSVWLREKENSWTERPDLMRFCVQCENSQSEPNEIHVKSTEYLGSPNAISKVIEREIPFFINEIK